MQCDTHLPMSPQPADKSYSRSRAAQNPAKRLHPTRRCACWLRCGGRGGERRRTSASALINAFNELTKSALSMSWALQWCTRQCWLKVHWALRRWLKALAASAQRQREAWRQKQVKVKA